MLAVSSLAWSDEHEMAGMEALHALDVPGIELIPRRIERYAETRDAGIAAYRAALERNNLQPVAMQAIYFGTPGLQLLQSEDAFNALVERSKEVAAIGDALGIPVGIFGAPGVRKIDGLGTDDIARIGADRLHRLDRALADHTFKLGLEPVPPAYGNHFLTTSRDIVDTLERIDAKNIALQLDIGCVTLGGGSIVDDISAYGHRAVHFHISERDLGGFDTPEFDHPAAGDALATSGYSGATAIEMKSGGDDWRHALSVACAYARTSYATILDR